MPNVRELSPSEEVSTADLEEIAQDIWRMIRRARATRESRLFLKKSLQQLQQELLDQSEEPVAGDLESLWDFAGEHPEACFSAIQPFSAFFNSHGLLPDDISPWSLLSFVLVRGAETGHFRPN